MVDEEIIVLQGTLYREMLREGSIQNQVRIANLVSPDVSPLLQRPPHDWRTGRSYVPTTRIPNAGTDTSRSGAPLGVVRRRIP